MFFQITKQSARAAKVSAPTVKNLFGLSLLALLTLSSCVAGTAKDHTNDLLTLETQIRQTNAKLAELRHRVSVMQYMVDHHERTIMNLEKKPALKEEENLSRSAGDTAAPSTAITQPPLTEERLPAPVPEAAGNKIGKPAAAPGPEQAYAVAREAFTGGDYSGAAKQFEAFFAQYPNHRLANNAIYWQGECFYARKKYSDAIACFERLVAEYPAGSKVPDAYLKSAYAYVGLDKLEKARTILKKVVKSHPFSPAAEKAEKMLDRLNNR